MKKVVAVLTLVFLAMVVAPVWAADQDFKEMYLRQRITALQMEIQILQHRFADVSKELPLAQQELKAYLAEQKRLKDAAAVKPEEKKKEVKK